jgi:uncharacterized membrane protein YkoI
MNKVNFKKVVLGVSLGTVMALGSMSSAFAADSTAAHSHTTTTTTTPATAAHSHTTTTTTTPAVAAHSHTTTTTTTTTPAPYAKHHVQQQVTLLTTDEANAVALTQYQGIVKDNQLTKEYGKDVYVIVIHSNDGVDHTVKVDARTGDVL